MFQGCNNLAEVFIPASVTTIGRNAFADCPNLTIYGKEGSAAETYANSNNIPFVAADADAISHIEVKTSPSNTAYTAGENFNPAGIEVVTVTFQGAETVITDYTITGGDTLQPGITNVTVSYTVGDKTYETTIPVPAVDVWHNCSFGNDLSMLYAIPKTGLEDCTSISLTVTREKYRGNDFLEIISETLSPANTVINGVDCYRFDFRGVAAKEMGDTLTAVLNFTLNGKKYSATVDTYSLKAYAMERLKNSTDESFKTLLVDLLNYGAAAQVYFGYRTNALINADLTDEQKTLATQASGLTGGTDSVNASRNAYSASITAKNIQFGNRITLLVATDFGENSDLTGVSLKIQYTDIEGNTVKTFIDSQYFVYRNDVAGFTAYFDGLRASEFRTELQLTLVKDGEAISETVTYSLNTYAENRLEKSNDENFKALLHATLAYADSARAYFSNTK